MLNNKNSTLRTITWSLVIYNKKIKKKTILEIQEAYKVINLYGYNETEIAKILHCFILLINFN